MIIKRFLNMCENKGCYRRISKSVVYLRNEEKGKNVKICDRCFRKLAKEK